MAILCPRCGRQYDVTLFEFGRCILCDCGLVVGHELARATQTELARQRRPMDHLRRLADRVCTLILTRDYPEVDIEIEKARLRDTALRLFPDRAALYEMIYESRFRRLEEQFRNDRHARE